MSTRNRARRLLALASIVVLVDAAWLVVAPSTQREEGFDAATVGVGLGAATSPAWSLFGVDPRLEASCEAELFPVPGLACPDPTHGTGVVDGPPRR